jgi:catechol 2,3-dioxygenase-like lactoylglutathione lyase family enzyme
VYPVALDHVAFWVEDRDPIVARCEGLLGMHVIDRRATFTLVGTDARAGKLTFFDAEGPRRAGVFEHVGLRVSDLRLTHRLLEPGPGATVDLGEGVRVRLVEGPTDVELDLDHVALLSPDPAAAAAGYERLGFTRTGADRLEVGSSSVILSPGGPGPDPAERPLLNHLGVLVASAEDHRRAAEALGIEVESTVDAANTRAVFLRGPDGVRIEYVEHKATFSLA